MYNTYTYMYPCAYTSVQRFMNAGGHSNTIYHQEMLEGNR